MTEIQEPQSGDYIYIPGDLEDGHFVSCLVQVKRARVEKRDLFHYNQLRGDFKTLNLYHDHVSRWAGSSCVSFKRMFKISKEEFIEFALFGKERELDLETL